MTKAVLRVHRDHPEDEGEEVKSNGAPERKRSKKRLASESRSAAAG
jgi:hypothetical protein